MKNLIKLKNLINIRNLIIIALCITIISLGIGFAFLSIELEKHNEKNISFEVSIVSVKPNTSIMGGMISPTATHVIADNKKTINSTINLFAPYDELSYIITIKNEGTIPAEIIDLIEMPNYLEDFEAKNSIYPVEINHMDIIGKTLEPGETLDLNVVASYRQTLTPEQKTINYRISIIASSITKEE